MNGATRIREIETPFLDEINAGGRARFYCAISASCRGVFSALPQSPQLFKQLLMVGGCEKNMQIVRSFRDEDPRADRQAEFTQLDVEMSFIDRENIISIMEAAAAAHLEGSATVEVLNPIPHMQYDEAMSKHGSDRPDLRYGMQLVDVTDLGKKTDFKVFSGAEMVKCIVVPGGSKWTRAQTDGLAEWAKGFGAKGLAVTKATASGSGHWRRQISNT